MITGYNENLPINRGDVVTIPKGTLIKYRGELKEITRAYRVKVDHVLSGQSIPVGAYFKHHDECQFFYWSRSDREIVRRLYGTEDSSTLWPLMTTLDHGNYLSLFLPIQNPEIVWAGRGGYWTSADINQIVG